MTITEHESIAHALVAFQAEHVVVAKARTANAGSYSYKYADLSDVVEAATPAMARHGLAFVSAPRPAERGYELAGTVLHTSGEKIEGSLALAGGNAQEIGSAITYARRYLLGCLLNIVTDDDEDGSLAVAGQQRRNEAAAAGDKARGELRTWAASAAQDLQALADRFQAEHGGSLRDASAEQVVRFHHALLTAHQAEQAVSEEPAEAPVSEES